MSKKARKRSISKAKQLGDFVLSPYQFDGLKEALAKLKSAEYLRLNHKLKSERVNRTLLEMIQAAPEGTFLLMAVVEFIDEVARQDVLINYNLTSFEIWLNQFSGLSAEDNYQVRAKIVGKWLPRDAYQLLFPVGMGKTFPGSHFVTAHASPDLDTTVASFWGWVDAFGARVAEGTHIWNVPGGTPAASIEVALLFHHIFGQNVFQHLAKTRDSLALSSLELMTQKGVTKQKTDASSVGIDHERTQRAVILVDDEGYFLGDWRSFDVEGVRQVIVALNNCLRWFENHLHIELISLFAEEHLRHKDLHSFIKVALQAKLSGCQPASEFTDKQRRFLEGYLRKVLKVPKGMEATFVEFADAMAKLGVKEFKECLEDIKGLEHSDLFDAKGNLIENRPKIFHSLEEIIALMDRAIQGVRHYTEKLQVALDIKTNVFGYLPQVVSYRADIDELRSKIGNYPYLTVTSADKEGRMIPLGVVRARDLHQPILGTVTLRDFCNRNETKIPSYFEVISVIDHHKCALQTQEAAVIHISDAQSSNTIVAELAFALNDRYSTGGMEEKEIEAQIKKIQKDLLNPANNRIMRRLLSRLQAMHNPYHVDPLREFIEYLHFLYAILDDTDLLTKVSRRDVVVVASILNRLKSLIEGEEVEIISFDDLRQDQTFVDRAATRILRHPDMYSLYKKIYLAKEQLVEENLALCAKGKESSIFVDTKLQNGCARVGQAKMFANNYPSFSKHSGAIRKRWIEGAKSVFADRREVDLHMQMVSTVAGAEDLYTGAEGNYPHKDELWIWIPMTNRSIEHLKTFLNDFRMSRQIVENEREVEVETYGAASSDLAMVFKESFALEPHQISEKKGKGDSYVVIRFPAGLINSRKAMISPYLPEPVA